MQKTLSILLLTLVGITAFLPAQTPETGISSNLKTVSIHQGGMEIENVNNSYFVKRDQFEIVFSYKKPIDLLVNASEDPESFDVFYEEMNIRQVPGFSGTGIAERLRNDSFDIILSADSPNSWFYLNETSNRFDQNHQTSSGIVSTRTVKNIRTLGGESLPVAVSRIQTLYLCIAEYEYVNQKLNILSRKRLKIIFE